MMETFGKVLVVLFFAFAAMMSVIGLVKFATEFVNPPKVERKVESSTSFIEEPTSVENFRTESRLILSKKDEVRIRKILISVVKEGYGGYPVGIEEMWMPELIELAEGSMRQIQMRPTELMDAPDPPVLDEHSVLVEGDEK